MPDALTLTLPDSLWVGIPSRDSRTALMNLRERGILIWYLVSGIEYRASRIEYQPFPFFSDGTAGCR